VNNLFLKDGRVRLLDPYLSRQNLVKDLSEIYKARILKELQEDSKESKTNETELLPKPPEKNTHNRFWQIQNLNFIALLACRLITLDSQFEPVKLLANCKVKRNQLYPIIKQIFKSANDLILDEHKVFPFICMLKRSVKTLMATDIRSAYGAVTKLQCYPSLDY
jgi:hypothetical protein